MRFVVAISLIAALGATCIPAQTTPSEVTVVEEEFIPVETTTTVEEVTVETEPEIEPETEPVPQYDIVLNEDEINALAKMAWGEARGTSDMEVAATMWCVLNRADNWDMSVISVITAPSQFHGYSYYHPVEDRFYNLAVDVLTRWQMEKQGATTEEVGRVLPQEYVYFYGDGVANHFRDSYSGGTTWDWSYPNPYEEGCEC